MCRFLRDKPREMSLQNLRRFLRNPDRFFSSCVCVFFHSVKWIFSEWRPFRAHPSTIERPIQSNCRLVLVRAYVNIWFLIVPKYVFFNDLHVICMCENICMYVLLWTTHAINVLRIFLRCVKISAYYENGLANII